MPPTYDFLCKKCGKIKTVLVGAGALKAMKKVPPRCDQCNTKTRLKLSIPKVRIK